MSNIVFKVSVSCFTFNQSKYIRDAMVGFCMQETNFPFVCTIVDDASTDGEQDVIQDFLQDNFVLADNSVAYIKETDYAHILFAQHKANKNCYFVVLFLKENHYKKKSKNPYLQKWRRDVSYIAYCEGDDYWIDPYKLQKQVDYMESHPECSYLFTDRYIDLIKYGVRKEIRYKKNIYTKKDIIRGFIPGLQTVLLKKEIFEDEEMVKIRGVNGDRLYAYFACFYGEIHCLHQITAVYRATGEGVSTSIFHDILYKHLVDDIYRFHHNLGVKDFWSYYSLQGKQIGNAKGKNFMVWCCNICDIFRSIDTSFRVYYLPILMYFYMLRVVKDKLGIGDPKMISMKLPISQSYS